MKKWILFVLVFLVIVTLSIFIFIPGEITIAGDKKVNCPAASINRLFKNTSAIKQWWPGNMINDTVYAYQDNQYLIPKTRSGNLSMHILSGQISVTGEISALLLFRDTAAIECILQPFASGLNPIKRLIHYAKAITIKKQISVILNAIKSFAEKTENIYGVTIVQAKVKDSSLISTSKTFAYYPTNEEIGNLIQKLKKYILSRGGEEKDFPMLNVNQTAVNNYEAMVAIPIVRDIPVSGDIIIKKMILGNILEAKITGGPSRILQVEEALKRFMVDYNKTSPAIPFQTLVTDRVKIKDTTRWVTYVKYPVF